MIQDNNYINVHRIKYNDIGLVDSIVFDNGAKVEYTYGLNGEKLKVVHRVPQSNLSGTGTGNGMIVQRPMQIEYDTREYLGSDVEIEGKNLITTKTYKYYFGDGYVQFYPGSSQAPRYYFYSKDHLGNVRSVVTKNPTTNEIAEVQQTHYYPFGGIIADLSSGTSVQNKLYNGKELDASNNLWWYDYGARQYDPTAPRFTTPDPLAEKYYSWNMYGYCMNNPVKFIDPDGKKIRFADGVSDTFKANFAAAIRYLKENKCDGLIAKLEKRNEIIYIAERSDGSSSGYNPDNYTIYWDPYGGVSTTNGQTISPTTVLNHEADHAYEHITNNTEYNKNKNTEDSNYGNKEEKRVITGTEQRTAFALGEIRANEKTRTNHSGLYYPTISPTSTELDINKKAPTSIDEIVITPQNN